MELQRNYLTEFSPEIVKTNKELHRINLQHNDLLDLELEKPVETLPNLRYVYMMNNQISCNRLEEIYTYMRGIDDVYLGNYFNYYYIIRKRYYLLDTLNGDLCLPIQTWVNVYNQVQALKKPNSPYRISEKKFPNPKSKIK